MVVLSPVQPPLAEQVSELVELQVSVVDPPLLTNSSAALSATVGCGAGFTWTNTEPLMDPPSPVQVSVKVVFAVSVPVVSLPETDRAPDQPSLAWQPVTFVDDQFNVVESPESIIESAALTLTVGAGGGGALTVTVTLAVSSPPLPEQVRV